MLDIYIKNNVNLPLNLSLYALTLVIIFDPSNQVLGLKHPLMVIVLLFCGLSVALTIERSIQVSTDLLIIYLVLIVVSLYGSVIGLMRGFNVSNDFLWYYLQVFFPFGLVIAFSALKIDYEKIFIRCMFVFVLSLFLFSVVILQDFGFYASLINVLTFEFETALIGIRRYGDYEFPMIYWKTSVLIVFLLSYLLNKNDLRSKLFFFLSVFVLFVSGTRANMFTAVLFLVIGIFNFIQVKFNKPSRNINFYLLVMIIGVVGLVSFTFVVETFLSPAEKSNAIKLGHLQSYLSYFASDLVSLFIGSGYGSSMYSQSVNSFLYTLELSYFELVRFYGVGVALVLISIFLYPAFFLYYKRSNYFFGWLAYLLIAGTNPLMLSSTGVFALILVYSVGFKNLIVRRNYMRNPNSGV